MTHLLYIPPPEHLALLKDGEFGARAPILWRPGSEGVVRYALVLTPAGCDWLWRYMVKVAADKCRYRWTCPIILVRHAVSILGGTVEEVEL